MGGTLTITATQVTNEAGEGTNLHINTNLTMVQPEDKFALVKSVMRVLNMDITGLIMLEMALGREFEENSTTVLEEKLV